MTHYEICNPKSGHSFGVYEAATSQDAIDACYRDAGYESAQDYAHQTECDAELVAFEV